MRLAVQGKNSIKGFSLIELLVVISIIAILATIAIPTFLGQRTKAAISEAMTNLQALRLIQEQYYAENGEYAPGGATSSGTLTGISEIMGNLPSFKPGNEENLYFTYNIVYTVISNITTSYIANAVGKGGTFVDGNYLYINQDNEKNF